MVRLARQDTSLRTAAGMCGVSRETVAKWVRRAEGKNLDEVDFGDRRTARETTHNRTDAAVEQCVLATRKRLHDFSDLGESGAAAIHRQMREWECPCLPAIRTINRILARFGAFGSERQKRPKAPPPAWYIPEVRDGKAELDACDFIEDLRITGEPDFTHVFNIVSAHGGLCDSFTMTQMVTDNVLTSLLARWKQHGLPRYAQFDNGTVFCGPPKPDVVGRVIRLCLQLGVTPIFAPPREVGPQNKIEGYNANWKRFVWRRFRFASREELAGQSKRYVDARNEKNARKIAKAPPRRPFPDNWKFHPDIIPPGKIIFIRRTDDTGFVTILQRRYLASANEPNRRVRCELDLSARRLSLYRLSRSHPTDQPLLSTHAYRPAGEELPHPDAEQPPIPPF